MGKQFYIFFLVIFASHLRAQVPTFTPSPTPTAQVITSQQLVETFYNVATANPANTDVNEVNEAYKNLMDKLKLECMDAKTEYPDNNVVSTPTNNSINNCISNKIKNFSPSTPPIAPTTEEQWKTNLLKNFTNRFLKTSDTFYEECTDHSTCSPSITKKSCLPLYEIDQYGKSETADQEKNMGLLSNLFDKEIIGRKPADGPVSAIIHCPSLKLSSTTPVTCEPERKGCRKAGAGEINIVGSVEGCEDGLELDPNYSGLPGEKLCKLKSNFIVDKLPEMLKEINSSTDGKLSEQFTMAYAKLGLRIDAAEIVFRYTKDHDGDGCSDRRERDNTLERLPYIINDKVISPHVELKNASIKKFNLKLNSLIKDFELLKKENPDLSTVVNFTASQSTMTLRELKEKNAGGAQYLKVMRNYLIAQGELYKELVDIYSQYKETTNKMVEDFANIDADDNSFTFFTLSGGGRKNFRNWKYRFTTKDKPFSGGKTTTEMVDQMATNNEIELDTLARYQIVKPLPENTKYIDPIIPQNYSTYIHWQPRFFAMDPLSKKCVSRDRDKDVDDRYKLRHMYKAWEINANAFYEERITDNSFSDDILSPELSLKVGCFEKGKSRTALSTSNLIKCNDKDQIIKEVAKVANTIQFAYNYNHRSLNYKFYQFGKNQNHKKIKIEGIPDEVSTADNNPRFLALIELDRNVKIMAHIVTKLLGFYEKSLDQINIMIDGPKPDTNTTKIANTYQDYGDNKFVKIENQVGKAIAEPIDAGYGNETKTITGNNNGGETSGTNNNSATNSGQSNRAGNPQTTLGASGYGASDSSSGSAMTERGGYDPNNPASSSGNSVGFNNGTNRTVAVKSMGSGTTIKKANGNDLGMGGFGNLFGNDSPSISPQSGLAQKDENDMLQHASRDPANNSDEDSSLFEDITKRYYRHYNDIFGKQKPAKQPITTMPDHQLYRAR
ncbi:MAG: hypothetical protein QE271_05175 [Bacteriovoracaceae bacterium]|nr:hypothetical protein [Bacteriovoracaceae bacterium]